MSKADGSIDGHGRIFIHHFLNDEGVGGYQKVWEKVLGIGFDFYLWMDSDLRLEEGAFASFFENSFFLRHKAVIAGTVSDLSGNLLSGGRSRHGRLLEPDPSSLFLAIFTI